MPMKIVEGLKINLYYFQEKKKKTPNETSMKNRLSYSLGIKQSKIKTGF